MPPDSPRSPAPSPIPAPTLAPLHTFELEPSLRRLSRAIMALGATACTLLFAACVSLGSLGLTWLFLRWQGYGEMGEAFWISLLVPLPMTLVFGGLTFVLVISLERARLHVDRLAMTDSLTGVHNRRHFMHSAQREIDLAHRHRLPLAVLILDIDRFKAINDTHGHAVGDQVLVEVSRRCARVLRATDLLARWGGEEFVFLLPSTPRDHAYQLAERLRDAVSASAQLQLPEQPIRVTVSIGAAGMAPGESTTLDALLQTADQALYHAKDSGRDRVHYAAWARQLAGTRA